MTYVIVVSLKSAKQSLELLCKTGFPLLIKYKSGPCTYIPKYYHSELTVAIIWLSIYYMWLCAKLSNYSWVTYLQVPHRYFYLED